MPQPHRRDRVLHVRDCKTIRRISQSLPHLCIPFISWFRVSQLHLRRFSRDFNIIIPMSVQCGGGGDDQGDLITVLDVGEVLHWCYIGVHDV